MSPRKKNLAALMRLMVRGFKRKDGTMPVPLINIVMSEKVAEDLLALCLLLIGKLRRTVMTADSRVVDLGEDVRFFNQAQRNALLIQSHGPYGRFGRQGRNSVSERSERRRP